MIGEQKTRLGDKINYRKLQLQEKSLSALVRRTDKGILAPPSRDGPCSRVVLTTVAFDRNQVSVQGGEGDSLFHPQRSGHVCDGRRGAGGCFFLFLVFFAALTRGFLSKLMKRSLELEPRGAEGGTAKLQKTKSVSSLIRHDQGASRFRSPHSFFPLD